MKGVWRAVPYFYWVDVFNYRADWFQRARAKVPTTWDELVDEGKEMKKFGKPFGFCMGHSERDPHCMWYSWLWAHGGREVLEDGKTVVINSPETLAAVKKATVLYDEVQAPAVLSWDDASNNRNFLAGAISGTFNAGSMYAVAMKDFPGVAKAMDHALQPTGPAGKYMWEKDPKMRMFNEVVKAKMDLWPGWPGPPSPAAAAAQARFIAVDLFAKACSREFTAAEAVKWAEGQLKSIYAEA